MGSGYFPLSTKDKENDKLVHARMLIKEYREELVSEVYSGESGGMQYDNAASDGGYLERLSIAIEMIDGCFLDNK